MDEAGGRRSADSKWKIQKSVFCFQDRLFCSMGQTLLFPDPKPLVERLGRDFFRGLPERPGIYLMRDAQENILYVGKARSLKQRLGSYRVANPDRLARRHLRLLRAVARIEIQECPDEAAALAREAELLLALKPEFNRAGTWPAKPRWLLWQCDGERLAVAISENPAGGWTEPLEVFFDSMNRSVAQPFLSAGSGDFPVASSEHGITGLEAEPRPAGPVNSQAGKPALQLCGPRRLTPEWQMFGPLGGGVVHLRAALVRLIWYALHPASGSATMPDGWMHGRVGAMAVLAGERTDAPGAGELERVLAKLFGGDLDGFVRWIGERTKPLAQAHDVAMRDADLETVTGFMENGNRKRP
jgi:predicted GIY-YIG superfamily endonuclease